MESALCDTQMAGVFVEFHDDAGNTVGQAVFTEWPALRLPAVGDRLNCQARSPTSGRSEQWLGRVRSRHFEVQEDDAGRACLWVRLHVAVAAPASRSCQTTHTHPCGFSDN
jgi:hypothetical protein